MHQKRRAHVVAIRVTILQSCRNHHSPCQKLRPRILVSDEIVNDASASNIIAKRLAIRISAQRCDRRTGFGPREITESVIILGLRVFISWQPFFSGVLRFD